MTHEGGTPALAQRVGDAEREICIDLLTDHHICGRLSAEDLDQRHRAALCAVTRDDLVSLLRDLPLTTGRPSGSDTPSESPVSEPPVTLQRGSMSWTWLAWILPPSVVVSAAALVSNYRTDLLDREDAFLAALAAGAAGVASSLCASLVNRRGG